MCKALKVAATMAAIGIAVLSLAAPARAGNGSAVGAGLVGFGVGALHLKRSMSLHRRLFIMCHRRRLFITGPWSMGHHIGTAITETATANCSFYTAEIAGQRCGRITLPRWLYRDAHIPKE